MVKKSALKQKTISHKFSKNRIRKVGKRMAIGKTKKVIPPNAFSSIFYDVNKTATQNMISYGLCPDPNMNSTELKKMVEAVPADRKRILPYHHLLREEEDSIWKHIVTPQEQMFLQELSNKYGRDFKKMAFDLKLNPFQYTPKQLEKKFAKYDKYLEIEKERLEQKAKRAQQRAEQRQKELEQALAEASSEDEDDDEDANDGNDDDDEDDDMNNASDESSDDDDDMSHLAQDEIKDFEASDDEDDESEEEDQEALKQEIARLEARKAAQQKNNKNTNSNDNKKKLGPQKKTAPQQQQQQNKKNKKKK